MSYEHGCMATQINHGCSFWFQFPFSAGFQGKKVLVSGKSGFSFWFQFLPGRRGWGIFASFDISYRVNFQVTFLISTTPPPKKKVCRKCPFARNLGSENEIFAISFAIASEFIRNANSQLFL